MSQCTIEQSVGEKRAAGAEPKSLTRMRGMAELQEIRKHLYNLDDEIAKNAEDRRQVVKYLFREEEGENVRTFALQLKLLEGERARLRKRQYDLWAQQKEILEKLEPTHGVSTSPPGGAGDQQQAAPPPPLAAAPPQSAATWWPACWIHGVTAPLWQVLGGGKGGQQQQQQLGDSAAAASTIPASAGLHSASPPAGTRTTALTSSACSSSPPPSQQQPSTCRQRRSHCAHPQQASAP